MEAYCPNCNAAIAPKVEGCPHCVANFRGKSWKPLLAESHVAALQRALLEKRRGWLRQAGVILLTLGCCVVLLNFPRHSVPDGMAVWFTQEPWFTPRELHPANGKHALGYGARLAIYCLGLHLLCAGTLSIVAGTWLAQVRKRILWFVALCLLICAGPYLLLIAQAVFGSKALGEVMAFAMISTPWISLTATAAAVLIFSVLRMKFRARI